MSKTALRKIGFTITTIFFFLSISFGLDGKLINCFLFMLLGTASIGIMSRYELL
jgi:hypothetical protein